MNRRNLNYIAVAAVALAVIAFILGINTVNSCTAINETIGNCANPDVWWLIGGLATVVAIGVAASAYDLN